MPVAARRAPTPNILDRLTADVIHGAFPDEALAAAREAVFAGRVSRPSLAPTRADAVVADGGRVVRARLFWSGESLGSSCDCGERRCAHTAALALLLVGEARPEEEGPSEPPPSQRAEERRRRQARGSSELFEIERRGGRGLYGEYQVSSPSSQAYRVTLRALDAPQNGCSCPDFATNLLGTCKHIEAVLQHLGADAPRRLKRATAEGPPSSYLHLVFEPEETIAVRLAPGARAAERRLAARHFGANGSLSRPLADVWPEVTRAAIEAGVEVPPEVTRHAERVLEADRQERRCRAVGAEVQALGCNQPGLRVKLYPYQVKGVSFLASRERALLADEMGLGKTAQAIAAMAWLRRRGEVRRALVICPASLKHQWLREIQQFTDLGEEDVGVVSGGREERRALYASAPPVLVTSYELARADEREILDLAPDLLVVDEAQRIKNWRTRTASVVKRIRSRFAFVLTGTPLENRLDDLYSLMQVVDPHLFGPLWRFNEEFTTLDAAGRPTGYRNLDLLRTRIAPVMLRRRKEEVLADLPERLVSRLTVSMTKEQRDLHDDAESIAGQLLARLKKRPLTPVEEQRLMRAFQRARMSCDAAGLVDKETRGAPKLDELERLLEEICLAGGHKAVIFSEWERMQAMAAEVCERLGIGHVRLHGGVPSDLRGRLIDRFREDPGCKVFLSTDAGGVGLNLQAASHVVNLDLPWNPAVLAQRIARVHRLGQREAVNVVLLVSEKSFEERIEGTLDAKRALFAAAVGDDQETVKMERSSMARRIATLLGGEFAASTGKPVEPCPPEPDPVAELRARAGEALERVIRLPDGRLVGVIRGDAPAVNGDGPALLPASAVEALGALGSASPFAGAEVLYQAPDAGADTEAAARRALATVAERKRAAGDALATAGQPAEALGLYREAMVFACRSLDPRGDPGAEPAALWAAIHGHLVPSGLVSETAAGALARAGEVARAFASVTVPPPPALVAAVAADARGVVAKATALER